MTFSPPAKAISQTHSSRSQDSNGCHPPWCTIGVEHTVSILPPSFSAVVCKPFSTCHCCQSQSYSHQAVDPFSSIRKENSEKPCGKIIAADYFLFSPPPPPPPQKKKCLGAVFKIIVLVRVFLGEGASLNVAIESIHNV